jgi:hypothetical protein
MKALLPLLAALTISAPAQANTQLERSIRIFCSGARDLNALGYSAAPGTDVSLFMNEALRGTGYTYSQIWLIAKNSGIHPCGWMW